jgi:hypothetical protein
MHGEPAVEIGFNSFAAAFEENSRAVSPAARAWHLIEQIEHANQPRPRRLSYRRRSDVAYSSNGAFINRSTVDTVL